MRRLLPLVMLLVALPSFGPAQGTGSALDRLTRREQTLGWEAMGRVEIGSGGFCTGTLIATDLVLTAAHCLFVREDGTARDAGTLLFRAGLRDGEAVAEARVARAVAHPGYDPFGPISAQSIRHDVALLQLATAIPAAVAAPFAVQSPGRTREVSVVSYAQGRADALSWQRTCRLLGRQDGLLAFDCDVDFGSSGAPVLDRSQGRARIVSIISSGRRDASGVLAFGMELPPLVSDLKAALRSGHGVLVAGPPDRGKAHRRVTPKDGTRDTGARFLRPESASP